MQEKKWKFREDMLGHYINNSSCRTFQDAENRLNYLENKMNKEKNIPKTIENFNKKYSYVKEPVITVDELISVLQKMPKDYNLTACGVPMAILIDHENKYILLDEPKFLEELIEEYDETEIEELDIED